MITELPPNRGAQLLLRCGTLEEIAHELGVSPRIVSRWRAGSMPGDDNIAKLKRRYDIPPSAWHQPARSSGALACAVEPPWLYEAVPALEASHPAACFALCRHVLEGQPEALQAHDEAFAAVRARHAALFAACEAAERALAKALSDELAA